jgi:hypothetical protein
MNGTDSGGPIERYYPGGGVNHIRGGGGGDDFHLGSGQDILYFGPGDGYDRVYGFDPSEDLIVIEDSDFDSYDDLLIGSGPGGGSSFVPALGGDVFVMGVNPALLTEDVFLFA